MHDPAWPPPQELCSDPHPAGYTGPVGPHRHAARREAWGAWSLASWSQPIGRKARLMQASSGAQWNDRLVGRRLRVSACLRSRVSLGQSGPKRPCCLLPGGGCVPPALPRASSTSADTGQVPRALLSAAPEQSSSSVPRGPWSPLDSSPCPSETCVPGFLLPRVWPLGLVPSLAYPS